MSLKKHIHKLAQLWNGVSFGTGIAIGDYSSTPTSFRLDTGGEELEMHRLIVSFKDSGSFDADKYGNGLILPNGIRIYHRDVNDDLIQEFTAFPVRSNADWRAHCHDVIISSSGTGDEVASVRWTFNKSGRPITLLGSRGEYLEILLNDDFSDLNDHKFLWEGIQHQDYRH